MNSSIYSEGSKENNCQMGETMKLRPKQRIGKLISVPVIVPWCSALLILLIIFFVQDTGPGWGSPYELPLAYFTVDYPLYPQVVLIIRKDGHMFVNEEFATMENIENLVAKELETAENNKLYLRVDKDTPFEKVASIIKPLKRAGVSVIGIIVEKKRD